MNAVKIKKNDSTLFDAFSRSCQKFSKHALSLSLIFLVTCTIYSQKLPDKIRGYKVYDARISVKTENDKIGAKDESEAFVKIGEPELTDVSLGGVTFELTAEISALKQSGTIDFLAFHDFRVNNLSVEVEEYRESFSFPKNQPIKLPKPIKIFLGTTQTLRGAVREVKEAKKEWQVTGRIFVFGKFKKFGFPFKRVIPIEINLKIKNPLLNNSSDVNLKTANGLD